MLRESQFKPFQLMTNRHLQTIVPNITHPALPLSTKHRVELDDGDFIDLLYGSNHSSTKILIIHGLEGSIHSPYASRIMNYCNANGISAVFMHMRSCSDEPNRLVRSYHSGATDDLQQIIEHLINEGTENIILMGYSLGGNLVLKYMGEGQVSTQVMAAMAVSVPFRLDICADAMDRGFAKVYQSVLLKRLIKKMQIKKHLLENTDMEFPDPAKMRNFREFDNHFTAPVHGFGTAANYYDTCSSRQFLRSIEKPTLILHASDDPFMTPDVVPHESELSSSVEFELSTTRRACWICRKY